MGGMKSVKNKSINIDRMLKVKKYRGIHNEVRFSQKIEMLKLKIHETKNLGLKYT